MLAGMKPHVVLRDVGIPTSGVFNLEPDAHPCWPLHSPLMTSASQVSHTFLPQAVPSFSLRWRLPPSGLPSPAQQLQTPWPAAHPGHPPARWAASAPPGPECPMQVRHPLDFHAWRPRSSRLTLTRPTLTGSSRLTTLLSPSLLFLLALSDSGLCPWT